MIPRSPHPRWILRAVALGAGTAASVLSLAELPAPAHTPLQLVMYAAMTWVWIAAAVLLIERVPRNPVGWILLVIGLTLAAYLVTDALVALGHTGPLVMWMATLVSLIDGPLFLLVASLFLLFPDGRLPSARWRWLLVAGGVIAIPVVLGAAAHPGSLGYYPSIENPLSDPASPFLAIWEVAYGLEVLVVAAAALSLVVRWRRSGPVERAQIKWIAAAAILLAVAMITYGGMAGPGAYSDAGDILVGIGFALVPVAITIAILRYRLYEIDRIISRTLGWAIVTGVFVAVFAAAVFGLQAALSGFTQGETLAVAASTLIALALLQPVRGRVHHAVDRRFDRARYDAEATADAFAVRLRSVLDLIAVERDLQRTATAAVQPRHARVWLRTKAASAPGVAGPIPAGGPQASARTAVR